MKILLDINVYEAAIQRINRIFDEFDNVICGFSGGKDSTVTFNLALKVARERNRLPLKVMFVDQEAEWQGTIDYIKTIMYNPDVEPYWIQAPFKITNSTSIRNDYLYAWGEGQEWMRPKDPIAIKENIFNTSEGRTHLDEFYAFFPNFLSHYFPNQKAAYLSGVRAQESPSRAMGLTDMLKYKDITWGKRIDVKQGHYTFYPLYDWHYKDIWKAIFDNNWEYCKIYDFMYIYGVHPMKMRISNLHHEQAIDSLFYMPEVETETYNKLCKRLNGISTANKMSYENFYVKKLPYMFESWKEYRDFLLDRIVPAEHREAFRNKFKDMDEKYRFYPDDTYFISCVKSVIINDIGFVKLQAWERSPVVSGYRKLKKGKIDRHNIKLVKLIIDKSNGVSKSNP